MQQGSFFVLLKIFHVKDLHTSTFLVKGQMKAFFYSYVGESLPYYKPPVIYILIKHTSTSFALSSA